MITGIGGLLLQMVLKRDTFLTQIETVRIISINGFHLRQIMEVISSTSLAMVVEAVVEEPMEVEEVQEVWLSFTIEVTLLIPSLNLKLELEVLGEDCGNPIKMDQEVIAL